MKISEYIYSHLHIPRTECDISDRAALEDFFAALPPVCDDEDCCDCDEDDDEETEKVNEILDGLLGIVTDLKKKVNG